MKIISLTQPYATAIALGLKHWETRSWYTSYRGLLGIHAAKGFPTWAKVFAREEYLAGRLPQVPALIPVGAIVAMVNMADCQPTENLIDDISELERRYGDYLDGRFAWKLEDNRALKEPVPAKGALGLWSPGPELEQAIMEQLAA